MSYGGGGGHRGGGMMRGDGRRGGGMGGGGAPSSGGRSASLSRQGSFTRQQQESGSDSSLLGMVRDEDDENDNDLDMENNDDDDDDNAAAQDDMAQEEEEDPFIAVMEDLEDQVVSALEQFKVHPGAVTPTVYSDLSKILAPALDIASKVGPAVGRNTQDDGKIDEIYQRLNSDLIFPVILECAQNEESLCKRAAAVEFFHLLHRHCRRAGSYLDSSGATVAAAGAPVVHPHTGPYGSGVAASSSSMANNPALRQLLKRRSMKRTTRTAELLRYWVEACVAVTNALSAAEKESGEEDNGNAQASFRCYLGSAALIKPSLRFIAEKISAADDTGALRLFVPLVRMITNTLKRFFRIDASAPSSGSAAISVAIQPSCVKLLEVIISAFSSRQPPQGGSHLSRRGGGGSGAAGAAGAELDFCLEDMPTGHPTITREALEEIAEYAFSVLRGLLTVGGQVKVDPALLENVKSGSKSTVAFGSMSQQSDSESAPSTQILDIVKPAALTFLEVESRMMVPLDEKESEEKKDPKKDGPKLMKFNRDTSLELDFSLDLKSYVVMINAIATLAVHRPVYFKDAVVCLTHRTVDPLPGSAAMTIAVNSQLRASCITLLRNALSVSVGGWEYLRKALAFCNMTLQADRALKAAQQAAALRTAGRAARNRAALFYQWDQSETSGTEMATAGTKRQRETLDDALAKMRAAKAARGLGAGIQLPSNMVDACELVLVNLRHLPSGRPGGGTTTTTSSGLSRKRAITLEYIVDAILSNGASLSSDESRWYSRDGGAAWKVVEEESSGEQEAKGSVGDVHRFTLDEKTMAAARGAMSAPTSKSLENQALSEESRVYAEQCRAASSDAFQRIVLRAASTRSKAVADFGNRVAARLAWTLRNVQPPSGDVLKDAHDLALSGASKVYDLKKRKMMTTAQQTNSSKKNKKKQDDGQKSRELQNFISEYPLVSSCLALDLVVSGRGGVSSVGAGGGKVGRGLSGSPGGALAARPGTNDELSSDVPAPPMGSSSLANRVLNEAYMESYCSGVENMDAAFPEQPVEGESPAIPSGPPPDVKRYDCSLEVFAASVLHACDRADEKPNDFERKKAAAHGAAALPQQLAIAPALTPAALELTSLLCDIEDITKRAAEAAKKSQAGGGSAAGGVMSSSSATASAHATARTAAEKRATAALLALRDVAFQRSQRQVRRAAVGCAVGIAAGRLPASTSIEDKALKLAMNVLYPKSSDLADMVVAAATDELQRSAVYAIENNERITKANENKGRGSQKNAAAGTGSDEEKEAIERVRKPVVLIMALCVRRTEIIRDLMKISAQEGANVLSKAVRSNMPKLARASATKYGAAKIAKRVAEMVDAAETPLLLAFLDNLVPINDTALPSQDLIDACHEIQSARLGPDEKKDARYIIPVVCGMKRDELVEKLPEFVASTDLVFKASLRRMSERVIRHALLFRDDPAAKADATASTGGEGATPAALHGMTLCEQLVHLHRLDFVAAKLPQKRYLEVIRLCLDDDDIFTDRVVMGALDYMSNVFVADQQDQGLPLAYMRTVILTCSKHESLHSWICHVLLPRLVEGRVYNDRRQWEGWMRCARKLENPPEGAGGVSSLDAIEGLPEEQLSLYRAKYPKK